MIRVLLPVPILAALLVASPLHGQASKYQFKVDERYSLSWWQVSPHLNHLWANTCPGEPSWQPGDERSSGWSYDGKKAPKSYHANTIDTIHVPLYPRPVATPICPSAVSGTITASDSNSWSGVSGRLDIKADAFVTGLDMRDRYATRAVLQASSYPTIGFRIDSLVNVVPGDTVRATAVGVFELRGARVPKRVPVMAWREAGGLRVTGQFRIYAIDLVEIYKMSRVVLGLGVGTGIWRYVHLGFDVVLRSDGS